MRREPRPRLEPKEQMLASMSGATITALTMTPFDVIKVRLQSGRLANGAKPRVIPFCNGLMDHMLCCQDPKGKKAIHCSRASAECLLRLGTTPRLSGPNSFKECAHSSDPYRPATSKPWYLRAISCPVGESNPFRLMAHLARTEGIGSLWSGLPATMIMAFPATILYFTSYEQFRDIFESLLPETSQKVAPFIGGAAARTLTTLIVSPMEMIRTRMQVDGLSWGATTSLFQQTFRAQGWRTLGIGFSATLLRDVPFSALYFGIYETLKKQLPIESFHTKNIACASCAAAIAGILTLPFDVMKTRQQTMLGSDMSRSPSISSIARLIREESGTRGFFRGFSPRLMKVVPACAIMMGSYEASKRYFSSAKYS